MLLNNWAGPSYENENRYTILLEIRYGVVGALKAHELLSELRETPKPVLFSCYSISDS